MHVIVGRRLSGMYRVAPRARAHTHHPLPAGRGDLEKNAPAAQQTGIRFNLPRRGPWSPWSPGDRGMGRCARGGSGTLADQRPWKSIHRAIFAGISGRRPTCCVGARQAPVLANTAIAMPCHAVRKPLSLDHDTPRPQYMTAYDGRLGAGFQVTMYRAHTYVLKPSGCSGASTKSDR